MASLFSETDDMILPGSPANEQPVREIRSMTSRPFGVNFVTQFTEEAQLDICLEEQVPVVSFF
jgi:hypothetical protein